MSAAREKELRGLIAEGRRLAAAGHPNAVELRQAANDLERGIEEERRAWDGVRALVERLSHRFAAGVC